MARDPEFTEDRRGAFGSAADTYRIGRPGYPPEVFEHLVRSYGLGPRCSVLEVGPGAGQATCELLAAGADVTAVEPASEFCEMLSSEHIAQPLTLVNSDFESAELEAESFDLVVAATSFHWVEPLSGLRRCADLLRPRGAVALWWTYYGDDDRHDPFRVALQPILRRHVPMFSDVADGGSAIGANRYALDIEARSEEFARSGRFGRVERIVIPWIATQTALQVRDFFASFSQWMALDPQVREALLSDIEELVASEFDGSVERPFQTAIYAAFKD